MKEYVIEFNIPGMIRIKAQCAEEACEIFRKQCANSVRVRTKTTYNKISKDADIFAPQITEVYATDRATLENLYNYAHELEALYPDSSEWEPYMIECLDDPVFIYTVEKYKSGVKPDDKELVNIIVEICTRLMCRFRLSSDKEDCVIYDRAKSVLETMKPLYPEYDWDWLLR